MTSRHPTPSKLEDHMGFWMRFVSNAVSAEFSASMAASGVSVTEWVAVRTLYDAESASHAGLAAALGMTKGAVSKVVSRLQDKGLVTREPHPDSKRAQTLGLTEAGRALVPQLALCADQNDERFFGHLSPAQRKQLLALLKEMTRIHQLKEVPVA
jgi:DNA-binding MarR family transcriptional regulator